MKRGYSCHFKWTLALIITIVSTHVAHAFAESAARSPRQAQSHKRANNVLIETDSARMTRNFTLVEGDCKVMWTLFESDPNRGVLQNYSSCRLALQAQMPVLNDILAAILGNLGTSEVPRTLVWGRLTPDTPRDDLAMAVRLALGAHRSPAWDTGRGKSRSGDLNGFVTRLANHEMIYSELRDLFNTFNLELKLVSTEKVLVLKAGRLPFFDRLHESGVEATEMLPFDCLAYFAISKGSK